MLNYVDPAAQPGITRKRKGRYWQYFGPDGERITDRDEIDRLNAIAMPPAYERCWFSPDPNGHIQGIGYDARGRRQYRYHAGFRAQQDGRKYERLAAFGEALPKLRQAIDRDIARRTLDADTVVAAVVRLIDETRMRIGNEEYAKQNKSYGATTLRNRHAKVKNGKLMLTYTGKHGIKHSCTITDRNLARIAKRTQELPGQNLFEFVGEDGAPRPVTSGDVNAYLQERMGEDFTAKDFRTWGASVMAFEEIARRAERADTINLKHVIAPVAEALGNTPAIARKSYVHPALLETLKNVGAIGGRKLPRATKHLSSYERGLTQFLKALPKAPGGRKPATGKNNGKRAGGTADVVA